MKRSIILLKIESYLAATHVLYNKYKLINLSVKYH